MEEPKVITIDDVIDSAVMHINKGNPLLRGNPKGTHTELKGNPVTGIIPNIYNYYLLDTFIAWKFGMRFFWR